MQVYLALPFPLGTYPQLLHDFGLVTDKPITVLQAADFFDDRLGLLEAIEEVAARLFLPERNANDTRSAQDAKTLAQVCYALLNV